MGQELWVLDPSTKKESLVADIYEGVEGSYPRELTVYNEKLYFTAFTKEFGRELYVYDEVSNEAKIVSGLDSKKDSFGKNNSSDPRSLTVYNNKLFF